MEPEGPMSGTSERSWSRKKRDELPRGLFVHPSSGRKTSVYGIRYMCGAGHAHQEKAGPLKSEAVRRYHERRGRMHDELGWCPRVERRQACDRVAAEREREARRMTFSKYAEDYMAWSATVHRAQRTAQYEVRRLVSLLGDTGLDAITPRNAEKCVRGLHETLTPASVNRLRDRLSGMFKRAIRLGLVERNPVTGIPKAKEAGGRLAFLSGTGESAVLTALPAERHALVVLAINTGLRWSEQARLIWRDVDLPGGVLTVCLGKNGHGRRLPVNRPALSALMDAAGRRLRPDDPDEPVFRAAYRTVSREFVRAVQAAQSALRAAGQEGGRRRA